MKWISRPSPAMVVAMAALFISLSGVSYGVATGFIDSREIKNNEVRSRDLRNNEIRTLDIRNNQVRGIDIRNSTVQGRDIALNTVTGTDVREDTLGKVPSAGTADTATSAGSADSVGGIELRRIAYSAEQGAQPAEILSIAGLTLTAECQGGPAIEIRADTTAPNSEVSGDFPSFANDDLDFDPGDDAIVLDTPGNVTGLIGYAGSDGRVVTVTGVSRAQVDDVRGTTDDCGFFGFAEAG